MGKCTEFLYLNEQEMIEAGVLDSARCIDVEEEIFGLLSKGDYVMGGDNHNSHGIMIKFPKESEFPNMPLDGPDRRFMAMPAYLGGRFNVCGVKWYGSNIINPQRGLPRSILMVMLNDPDTCEPIALMSANLISSVRTGCVPGVATRHLARKDAAVCTCIGAGPVSKACFDAIVVEAKNLKEVVIFDIVKEKGEAFAREVRPCHLRSELPGPGHQAARSRVGQHAGRRPGADARPRQSGAGAGTCPVLQHLFSESSRRRPPGRLRSEDEEVRRTGWIRNCWKSRIFG